MRNLKELVRPNIWNIAQRSSSESRIYRSPVEILLDANENPYNKPLNRYPCDLHRELKTEIEKVKGVEQESIFLCNGSDESIDIIYRCFCRPGIDNVVAIEPTYSAYRMFAEINGIDYRSVELDGNFNIDADRLLAECDDNTKLIWICSPNNPTGNNICRKEIEKIIARFEGIVVVDEAYSDFSTEKTFRSELADYPNVVILNTMSNSWGCAAIRLGMVFAHENIIKILESVAGKHRVNTLTVQQAADSLRNKIDVEQWVNLIIQERRRMIDAFKLLPMCEKVYPSDANFFLAKMTDANELYRYLMEKGIAVHKCDGLKLCENCIRITIGTKGEHNKLLAALRMF